MNEMQLLGGSPFLNPQDFFKKEKTPKKDVLAKGLDQEINQLIKEQGIPASPQTPLSKVDFELLPKPSRTQRKVYRRLSFTSSEPNTPIKEMSLSGQNTPVKGIFKFSKEYKREQLVAHANHRIIHFVITAFALSKLPLRSAPQDSTKGFAINIGPASIQVGKATDGKHAAHMNAAAGFIDNLRDQYIDQLVTEKQITPAKSRLLASKGFSPADLKIIDECEYDLDIVKYIFDTRWPRRKDKADSIFTNTRTDKVVNQTTNASITANLCCDKKLERVVRPEIPNLYFQVINGEEKVGEITQQYIEIIKRHFTVTLETLELFQPLMNSYQTAINDVMNHSELTDKELDAKLDIAIAAFNDLKIYTLGGKAKVKSEKLKLNENAKFIKSLESFRQKDYIKFARNWLRRCSENLKLEADIMSKKLTKYRRIAEAQLEGSTMPKSESLEMQFRLALRMKKLEQTASTPEEIEFIERISKTAVEDILFQRINDPAFENKVRLKMLETESPMVPDKDLTPHIESFKRELEFAKDAPAKRTRLSAKKIKT